MLTTSQQKMHFNTMCQLLIMLLGLLCSTAAFPVRLDDEAGVQDQSIEFAASNEVTPAVTVETAMANWATLMTSGMTTPRMSHTSDRLGLQQVGNNQAKDDVFVVTLAEYVSKKYRRLAEQYAKLALGTPDAPNGIDPADLSFLAEATAFLKQSLLPYSRSLNARSRTNANLRDLKAALALRAQQPAGTLVWPANEQNGDDADIPVEVDDAVSVGVAFRNLSVLPHICKQEKYKNTKMCKG